MPSNPVTLTDQHRTLILHVFEMQPEQYTWRMVLEETCGCADGDCTFEAQTSYPTRVQAEAAAWAEGNRLLHGPRIAGECGPS
jgi:hypothetical protein